MTPEYIIMLGPCNTVKTLKYAKLKAKAMSRKYGAVAVVYEKKYVIRSTSFKVIPK